MSNLTSQSKDDKFIYKNKNDETTGPRLLGYIFLASGIIVIIISLITDLETEHTKIALVSGAALVIGVILSSFNSRILFDFHSRKLKKYQSILWFKSGEWEQLPEIDKVELIHHSFRTSYIPNGITPTLNGQKTIYKIVLLANGAKFLALDFNREKDAIDALEKIKRALRIL